MITVKKISKSQLAEYVDIAYRGDQDLLERYHIRIHKTVESAVISTMLLINDASFVKDLCYYKMCWQKKPIGYLVVFKGFLYSFGVNMKFRKPEIHRSWWTEVKKILGSKFMSMLYDNNSRAVEFLVRQGMQVVEHNPEQHLIYLQCL